LGELRAIGDVELSRKAPTALNSLVFRLDSLVEAYNDFATNLYIAKRFHMKEQTIDYFDFQRGKSVLGARVFSFEQDIRDYISASTQAIVVQYGPGHFKPLASPSAVSSLHFWEPTLY
jgi:hypothetical protein